MTVTPPCKVSLLVSDLSSQGAGRWGGGVRPFLLSQALQRAGHTVEIVGFNQDPDIQFAVEADIKPLPFQGVTSIFSLLRHLTGEVVIAYKLKPSSFGLALVYRLLKHRPVVLDIDDWELSWHGGDQYRYHPSLKQLARDLLKSQGALREADHPLYLQWIESLVSRADHITTHTQFLHNRFGGTYLPNGKDTDLFNPHAYEPDVCRTRYGLQGYRVLMFPGAPRPYKGVEDILMALDQLDEPTLKLVIVGGSPYDDYDHQLYQKWGHRIIQLPKTPYHEMPALIAAAHVVVVPQRNTPAAQAQFPLKLTDGMAMAKPILATRVGDIPDILAATGYLVDADTPSQLADEIRYIFQNYEEALSKGQQARRRCINRYSIQAMGEILTGVINQVTAGSSLSTVR